MGACIRISGVFSRRSIIAPPVVRNALDSVSEVTRLAENERSESRWMGDFRHTIPCALDRRLSAKKHRDSQKNMPNPWYGTVLALSCSTNHQPTPPFTGTQSSSNSAQARSRET